mmetsp:Transcript_65096/g.121309  ORF Transcript_65096/g.121309 Transcript_65096/m.121309 type:complete len:558 (-) Transcript_65096:53-1726(-)
MLRWVVALVVLACATHVTLAEEEEASPVATAISVMLLGSIGFQMLLFYMVNFPDADMQRYTWQVLSQTISIFSAVLLYQAFNGAVETYVIEGGSIWWELSMDALQFIFWLSILNLVLAYISGAIGEPPRSMKIMELNVKSWSVLFAHITGFAAINAVGSFQQHLFNRTPGSAMIVVPVFFVIMFAIYKVYDLIRDKVSLGDDGELDEFEEKWDEEAEEAENDVAALSLSFTTCQVLRFGIGGSLPNQEGEEEWAEVIDHGGGEWQALMAIGFTFVLLSVVVLRARLALPARFKEWERSNRMALILNQYCTCANAWCFFYSALWAIASCRLTPENSILHVLLALVLSFISFLFIFILDKIEDYKVFGKGESTDEAIEKTIEALGILVGFSWEQSFDVALTAVTVNAKDVCPPALSRALLSVVLVGIVFPAWRIFILPTEQTLNEKEGVADRIEYAETYKEAFIDKGIREGRLDATHFAVKALRKGTLQHKHHEEQGYEPPALPEVRRYIVTPYLPPIESKNTKDEKKDKPAGVMKITDDEHLEECWKRLAGMEADGDD